MTGSLAISAETSRKEALVLLRRALDTAGIPSAALDARLLLSHALRIEASGLITQDGLPLGSAATIVASLLARRLAGESVARLIGMREFWGLPFRLSPDTLEPRPDTETLVEAVLALHPDRQAPLRLLDLGTGTGCILIALLTELPNATGIGADISIGARAMARKNARLNDVADRAEFIVSDWFDKVEGRFDVIVSNPPYISTAIIGELDREVRDFDPARALDGGADGLDAYRRILASASGFLAPGGCLAVEIGFDQQRDIEQLAAEAGFTSVQCRSDLAGQPRVVTMEKPGSRG